MAKRRTFTESDERELLEAIGQCRKACVTARSRAPINAPIYEHTGKLMSNIDELAKTITGKRDYFHLELHSAPDTKPK